MIPTPSSHPAGRQGRMLTLWTPEDKAFWEREGEAIAKINLWISVPALFLAFCIWQVWSVVAVNLPALGFKYSTNQLFWLAAAPALSGATLRIFYSFMVPVFGGRRWTALSTASLLIPAIGIGMAVQDNTTSYPTMLVLALLCGLGGGLVTFWNFIVMALAVLGVLYFLPKGTGGYALPFGPQDGSFGGFFAMFLVLFLTTGIGNGSTFRMIPVIFLTQKLRELRSNTEAAKAQAIRDGNTEGAAAVGFAGALGAYGGFFIPKSYGSSIAATGGPEFALWMFAVFYTLCIVITWWYYARKSAEMPC